MIKEVINPDALQAVRELSKAYAAAQPFPHVVMESFLTPAVAARLLDQFPAFETGNSVGDDGKPGNKATFERIRSLGPDYQLLDHVIQQREFLDFVGSITGITDLIYDPFYLGGALTRIATVSPYIPMSTSTITPARVGIAGSTSSSTSTPSGDKAGAEI
jgi:hypothetical protein